MRSRNSFVIRMRTVIAVMAVVCGKWTSASAQSVEDFVDSWVNANPETDGITRILIEPSGEDLTVHAYGRCSPDDCDWGAIAVSFSGNPLTAVYEFGFVTTTMTLCLIDREFLFVTSDDVFHDGSQRDYVADAFFNREGEPPDDSADEDALADTWVNINSANKETEGLETVRVTRVVIERSGADLRVSASGVCQPADCSLDWGTVTIPFSGNPFVVQLDRGTGPAPFTFHLLGKKYLHIDGGRRAESVLRRAASAGACFGGVRPAQRFRRGDCNADGHVEGQVTDAVFLLNYNFEQGLRPPCLAACDANGDGRVSGAVTDAVYILTFNFLNGPAPPAPYPGCGAGSEADLVLGCEYPSESCEG